MYRLWRDQTLYQIAAKSNNRRLSYSDLKNENLGAKLTLDFMDSNHCVTSTNPYPSYRPNISEILQYMSELQ